MKILEKYKFIYIYCVVNFYSMILLIMKNLKRIILWVIFVALILVFAYLLTNWVTIVKSEYENVNLVIYILLFVIFLYYLIFYIIKPTYIKRFKVINTILGLLIIFIGQYFVANSWVEWIYYGDIVCIIWVVLTIIWPTNLLVSKELEDSKKVEIIEA